MSNESSRRLTGRQKRSIENAWRRLMKPRFHFALLACIGLVFGHSTVVAQERARLHPLQPSDTSSPRATLASFIDSCNEFYDLSKAERQTKEASPKSVSALERILDCLDLSKLPSELRDTIGLESAIYLKEVLDRIELPTDKQIPGVEAVQSDTNSEEITRWRIPLTRMIIAKVQEGPSQGAYLFTPETVRRANGFYSAAKQLPYRTEGRKVSEGFYDLYVSITRRQPTLSADTSSPRGTLNMFLDSVDEIYEVIRKEKHLDRNDPKHLPTILRIIGCLDEASCRSMPATTISWSQPSASKRYWTVWRCRRLRRSPAWKPLRPPVAARSSSAGKFLTLGSRSPGFRKDLVVASTYLRLRALGGRWNSTKM